MINNVLEKLIKEKFNGKNPEWKKAKWGDVNVLCSWDDKNWYYQHNNVIIIQSKQEDYTPHCYECSSKIDFKAQRKSIWFGEFDGCVGGGEVKTEHIPYCPKCEKEPSESGVIIEKSGYY